MFNSEIRHSLSSAKELRKVQQKLFPETKIELQSLAIGMVMGTNCPEDTLLCPSMADCPPDALILSIRSHYVIQSHPIILAGIE